MSDDFNFCRENPDDFPCDIDEITAVSLGLGAGGLALFFVVYLYFNVSSAGLARVSLLSLFSLTHSTLLSAHESPPRKRTHEQD